MEVYDKQAAEFIERAYRTPEIVNQRLHTLAALGLAAGEAVLDAGCGTGLLLELEAAAVGSSGRADGVDLSEDMLAVARERCGDLPQVKLQQGSVAALPFTDASFAAASCTQTLLYVDELDAALAELHRVLKPRGRLALVETDWSGTIVASHDQSLTRRIFDAWGDGVANPNLPRRLKPLLEAAGFGGVRVEAVPIVNLGSQEGGFSAGMLKTFVDNARKRGVIDDDEAAAWRDGIEQLSARGEYFFCVNRFLFSAIK